MSDEKIKKVVDAIFAYSKSHNSLPPMSRARLTKLVYLVDWHSCLRTGRPATDISWFFDRCGPHTDDVEEYIHSSPDYEIYTHLGPGDARSEIKANPNTQPALCDDNDVTESITAVMDTTSSMPYDAFLGFVHSTRPLVFGSKFQPLDLIGLVKVARQEIETTTKR